MKNSFSPSINIIRDQELNFDYLSTPNSEQMIRYLNQYVSKGIKSFSLVGSYGTGKSAFILALEKQISDHKGKIKYFDTPIYFNGKTKYEKLNFVGDLCSLEDAIRDKIEIKKGRDIIEGLQAFYYKVSSPQKGLIIAIDEFGKYLEYAVEKNSIKDIYFIQKLSEYVNRPDNNIILLTALHQGFHIYGKDASEKIKNEWNKVKGRLIELPFNEPVEQLLHLASKYLNGKVKGITLNDFKKLFKSIIHSRVYPLTNDINLEIAEGLFPLEILSAGVLTKSLQRYGQNERSLFTFLETSNITKNLNQSLFFNLTSVYDYLINNFYSILSTKQNPDFLKWSIIKSSIERSEIYFGENSLEKEKLIKAIGLLNIFAPSGSKINKEFLSLYGKIALDIPNVVKEIDALEQKKIIRFRTYSESYILYEGTDIDLDLAMSEAALKINTPKDITPLLLEYFDLPFVLAKREYIITGTPRIYEFVISNEPVNKKPSGEIDGYINILFNEKLTKENLIVHSKKVDDAIIYVLNNNVKRIKEVIEEILKVNNVIESSFDDRVATRELKSLKENLITELNDLVLECLFENSSKVLWIYKGLVESINHKQKFNKLLSKVIKDVYPETPVYLNELVNREKLSSQISKARKELIYHLITGWEKEDLGYSQESYPPDKTIYLSLLKNTGIHKKVNNKWDFTAPKDESFNALWNLSEGWFNSSKFSKKSVLTFYELLLNKPFKLKQGFADFWVPIFLFIKRDDFALYNKDTFIPELDNDMFDLMIRYPHDYFIKAFDLSGLKTELFNKYRNLINLRHEEKITRNSFIVSVKPLLKFYRELPAYVKQTKKLSKTAINLRSIISSAKDPEKLFFEEIPIALGFSTISLSDSEDNLNEFISKLRENIKELRICYDQLLNRIEIYLLEFLNIDDKEFAGYKLKIIEKYSKVKTYLLPKHLKLFHNRLNSPFDDKASWFNALIYSLMDKNLDNISDEEEDVVYEKLAETFRQLDNYIDFTNLEIDVNKEEAFRIEVTTTENVYKDVFKVSLKQMEKAEKAEAKIRELLKENKSISKLILLNLLKEEMNK